MWLELKYTKPHKMFQQLLDIYYLYIKYISNANSYLFNSKAQNN